MRTMNTDKLINVRAKVKTTEKPIVCPCCSKAIDQLKVDAVEHHDGGVKVYFVTSQKCGHTFKLTI